MAASTPHVAQRKWARDLPLLCCCGPVGGPETRKYSRTATIARTQRQAVTKNRRLFMNESVRLFVFDPGTRRCTLHRGRGFYQWRSPGKGMVQRGVV